MKKRILSLIMALTVTIAAVPCTYASDLEDGTETVVTSGVCGESLTWSYDEENKTLSISGTGDMYDYSNGDYSVNAPWEAFRDEIEDIDMAEGITSISANAFCRCTQLKNIDIPDSVVEVRDYAFYECTDVNNIKIGDGLTETGYEIFSGCNPISLEIGDGIKSTDDIFVSTQNLMKLDLGNGLEEITDGAFDRAQIAEVTIPPSVKSIGSGAFRDCENLILINMSGSVEYCGVNAFVNTLWYNNQVDGPLYLGSVCVGYKGEAPEDLGLVIPDGITTIARGAFTDQINIVSVTLPDTVMNIGMNAFDDTGICAGQSGPLYVGRFLVDYRGDAEENTTVTISDKATAIADGALSTVKNLTGVIIPDGVMSIGREAFSGSPLKSVAIPDSVTEIGEGIFSGCTELTYARLSENLTEIPESAFKFCTALEGISIPDSVKEIKESAFIDCYALENVKLSENLEIIGHSAFCNCETLNNVVLPDKLKEIKATAFYNCTALDSISIPDSVTRIERDAFYKCTSLANLELGSGSKEIRYGTFYECEALNEIIIPEGVEILGYNAFGYCKTAKNLVIADSVNQIHRDAFYGVWELENIKIGDGVTDLELIPITSYIKTLELGKGITEIPMNTISYNYNMESMVIPKEVTTIGSGNFLNCSENIVIYGWGDTAAEEYAIENKVKFFPIDALKVHISHEINPQYSEENKTLTTSVNVEKYIQDGESLKVRLFFAAYTDFGMSNVTAKEFELSDNESYIDDVVLEGVETEPSYIKIFVFDGEDGLTPLDSYIKTYSF